ncbi:MAG TPA: AMP-binding protein, partial [Ilumatobacteraceae bacterium]
MPDADMSWVRVLEHHAARTPDKPLAVCDGRAVTYHDMADRAARIGAGLIESGVRDGDVVGLLAYNSTEFLTTIFAANHIGAIAMPINWRLAAPELRYLLEHSQARALVCDPALAGLADAATEGLAHDLAKVCIAADT